MSSSHLATVDGQSVVVVRPDQAVGQGSVDVLCALASARANGVGACLLPSDGETAALVGAIEGADVPWIRPSLSAQARLARQSRRQDVSSRLAARWCVAKASGLQELYRELRRHAGNERLSFELRTRLRQAGHHLYERAVALRAPQGAYPRRVLRERSSVVWSADLLDRARARLKAAGVPDDAPIVAFEATMRPAVARAAIRYLSDAGFVVVRVGAGQTSRVALSPLVDIPADALSANTLSADTVAADLQTIVLARFAIVGSPALQQLTYLTNTPSLTVDATDVFTQYPIRPEGLLLLATAIDLDTGRALALDEWLSDAFFKGTRNHGHRGVTADALVAAIQELRQGVAEGWSESDAQRRFRDRVVQVGEALAPTVPLVARWGPDAGFIGDGRIARVQAERAA